MSIKTIPLPGLTEQQKTMHKLMFVAVCKLLSDQSTYLQNELKYDLKRDFNNVIKRIDELVEKIDKGFSADEKESLQEIVDELNNAMTDFRKQINELK